MTERLVRKFYLDKQCCCSTTILQSCKELWHVDLNENTIQMIKKLSKTLWKEDICEAYISCLILLHYVIKNADMASDKSIVLDGTSAMIYDFFTEQYGSRRCGNIKLRNTKSDVGCLYVLVSAVGVMNEIFLSFREDTLIKNLNR